MNGESLVTTIMQSLPFEFITFIIIASISVKNVVVTSGRPDGLNEH